MVTLGGFDEVSYPYVAMVGMTSKLLIFDVATFTVVQSFRTLVSNWHLFKGISAVGDGLLIVGGLDGSAKLYEITKNN